MGMWQRSIALRFFITFTYILLSLCAYSAWFYYRLSLSFSALSFFYTTLFAGIITACIFLCSHIAWKCVCYGAGLVFMGYSLISFLHFSVFKTFLSFSVGSELSAYALWTTIVDFYYLVPVDIYAISGLWLIFFTIPVFISSRKKSLQPQFCGTPIVHRRRYIPSISSGISTLIICLCLGTIYVGVSHYREHPKEKWWDQTAYYGDNGLFGFIYGQLFSYWQETSKSVDVAFAQELIQESQSSSTSTQDSAIQKVDETPKTPFDYIEMYIDTLLSSPSEELLIPHVSSTPHIIVYQLESIDSWIFGSDPHPMPFLKQLMENNIHVDHFLANGCHTIDAEFATMCSFYPHSKGAISSQASDNNFYCLPSILNNAYGYRTSVFHSNKSDFWNRGVLMKKWGINDYYFVPEFPFPRYSDDKVIERAVDYISSSSTPSFSYIISYTSHAPHTSREMEWNKKYNAINITPYEGTIDPLAEKSVELDKEGDIRAYIGFAQEIDRDIAHLFDLLSEKKLLKNTIVVIATDHRYYNFKDTTDSQSFFYYNELPFMIYVPGGEQPTPSVRQYASHIDIAPTLLNIIEGESYQKPQQFIGESLFDSAHPNHAYLKCLGQVNFASPEIVISGNNMLNVYQDIFRSDQVSEVQKDLMIRNINTLSHYTNSLIDANLLTAIEQ